MEKEGEMRMERQKGQSMVEFAFILPLFVFIFLAIMYMGMLFADYLSFNDIARSAARYAAINGTDATTISTLRTSYDTKYSSGDIMHTSLYKWNPESEDDFYITKSTDGKSVSVKIVLRESEENEGVSMNSVLSFAVPKTLTITYEMYNEKGT